VLARPVSLFVGRVSYEKNIEAFLKLDVPGTKVVCGVGPLETDLKARFPGVRWMGLLARDELAAVYASADVFVLPSKSETFGLVMLEAIRDFYYKTGKKIAMKPAGGISKAKLALHYLVMLNEVLGEDWMNNEWFRFGASSLANDILMQLMKQKTGVYQSANYFSID
jgi:deoxyribose-phosphate aldolase